MIAKKRLMLVFSAMLFMLTFTVLQSTAFSISETKNVSADETWIIEETTKINSLTIAEGAVIAAPEGHSITMTVDGVETALVSGTYRGDIVLTPVENIAIAFSGMGASVSYNYRTAIYVNDGAYVPDKSVASAVVGGNVTSTSAVDVNITSKGENFNGIMTMGQSKYSISNPKIDFTGNGGNDFAGYGAAIMSSGNADVTVENAEIITRGAVRTAIFIGGDSTMNVNDSYIEVHNGTLPDDYEFSVMPGQMKEVPWMLGIKGNVRAVNVTGNGTAYFNDTHIKAQGWGCLSTDDVTNTRVYATNCLIETVESGYGGFSLGGNISTFSDCTFNVADIGLISQDGDAVFTDGTMVNSGRFGAMYFGSSGDLTIDNGCEFNTESTTLLMKGSNSNIVVEDSELNPENGIILQMMANDDPFMSGGGMGGPPGGGMRGGPGGGMRGGPGGDQDGMRGGPGGEGMPGGPGRGMRGGPGGEGMPGGIGRGMRGGPRGGGSSSSDINATFKNVTLNGDIVNGNTAAGDLIVSLENATITGAITTATIAHALGPNGEEITMEHPELYYLIGEITNTYCATNDEKGVSVSLDATSQWIIDETSYLTGLAISKGATATASKGFDLTMTVDDVEVEIQPGTYEGKIVLSVHEI